MWSSRRGHSFILGLNATLFQAAIHNIKVCVMENIGKVYTDRNICSFSDSEAAIKALDNIHMNYKLVGDCHQSMVKLAEHNRIRWVVDSRTHGS